MARPKVKPTPSPTPENPGELPPLEDDGSPFSEGAVNADLIGGDDSPEAPGPVRPGPGRPRKMKIKAVSPDATGSLRALWESAFLMLARVTGDGSMALSADESLTLAQLSSEVLRVHGADSFKYLPDIMLAGYFGSIMAPRLLVLLK